jgi:proline dehydrogenase
MRVEMEDVRFTDATLSLYESLRTSHSNTGIVLQSRLFRTPADIAALSDGDHDVRLVKGVYLEPREIAHTDPKAVNDAYLACAEKLLDRDGPLSFATHDDVLVARLTGLIERAPAPPPNELQVLDGVRPSFWEVWRAAGHTVRVYVPYGPDWRAYSIRRMRKNPQMFRAVTRSVLFGE